MSKQHMLLISSVFGYLVAGAYGIVLYVYRHPALSMLMLCIVAMCLVHILIRDDHHG